MELLFIIYVVAGYWAAGVVFFENKIVFQTKFGELFIKKLALGIFTGIIIIPIAILKKIFYK